VRPLSYVPELEYPIRYNMYFGIRSNDGKELYFSGADKIMAVPIQNTESFQFGTHLSRFPCRPPICSDLPQAHSRSLLVFAPRRPHEHMPLRIVLNWTETPKK
jgi:hypothetical protein